MCVETVLSAAIFESSAKVKKFLIKTGRIQGEEGGVRISRGKRGGRTIWLSSCLGCKLARIRPVFVEESCWSRIDGSSFDFDDARRTTVNVNFTGSGLTPSQTKEQTACWQKLRGNRVLSTLTQRLKTSLATRIIQVSMVR